MSETICMASEKTDKWRGSCLIWRRISCHNIRATYSLLVQCWAALKPMIVIISLILYFLLDVFPFAGNIKCTVINFEKLTKQILLQSLRVYLRTKSSIKIKTRVNRKIFNYKAGRIVYFWNSFPFFKQSFIPFIFFTFMCKLYLFVVKNKYQSWT